ncbi:MAG TPA: hypothetical protein VHQ43_03930 [Solirubrobacterales bacterium]|jgi:hypothetical protein|nr:hypothetical protein [Solirubrobacterales bacterium]
MAEPRELGVDSVCCLLHNMIPGGSGRQWIHLLGRHVEAGGKATIVSPPGLLQGAAETAGIEFVATSWYDRAIELGPEGLRSTLARHDAAIVHWDHRVMDALEPALASCERVALSLHQTPDALASWLGPQALAEVRVPIALALAEERAAVLVRGEWHRERFADAFDLPADTLSILPASIPLDAVPFQPQLGEPREILALMRLAPEKAAIAQLAVELTRERLAASRPCRLTIAGEGDWRVQAEALCQARLPREAWRIEEAPANPVARLFASDLIVAQGLTTLEAAAIGRRVVVARPIDESRAAGVVLTPERYDVAARDPFGKPQVTPDAKRLWGEVLALDEDDLHRIRRLVEEHNSLAAASQALAGALDVGRG